jgi:putative signal transducing protein
MSEVPDNENAGHGKLIVLARFFVPMDAYVLKACLESNDVPAVVADAHMVQANEFLTTAIGGVRVLVPESHFERALEIQKAFDAGEYQLDDDFDVGEEVK